MRKRFGDDRVPAKPRTFRARAQPGETPRPIQEAHEAIRPTGFGRAPEDVEGRLARPAAQLHALIWKRAPASRMSGARFDRVQVEPACGAGGGMGGAKPVRMSRAPL